MVGMISHDFQDCSPSNTSPSKAKRPKQDKRGFLETRELLNSSRPRQDDKEAIVDEQELKQKKTPEREI